MLDNGLMNGGIVNNIKEKRSKNVEIVKKKLNGMNKNLEKIQNQTIIDPNSKTHEKSANSIKEKVIGIIILSILLSALELLFWATERTWTWHIG